MPRKKTAQPIWLSGLSVSLKIHGIRSNTKSYLAAFGGAALVAALGGAPLVPGGGGVLAFGGAAPVVGGGLSVSLGGGGVSLPAPLVGSA